jgi:transposase
MSLVDAVDGSSSGTSVPWMWALLKPPRFKGANHSDVHGYRFRHRQIGFPSSWVGACGQVVIRRQFKRRYVLAFFQKLPPCLVGIEACASSHHWSRELKAIGHTVRLIPPAYVTVLASRATAICAACS